MNYALFLKACPYLAIALLVTVIGTQSRQLTEVQKEFEDYKQEQQQANEDYTHDLERLRTTNEALAKAATAQLATDMDAGEVFRRCVAAGKCRSVPVKPDHCPAAAVQTVQGSHEARGTTVPVTTEPAASGLDCSSLVNDAAQVQLRLNLLQAEIESQPNYAVEDP